jgi:hypothetical protein
MELFNTRISAVMLRGYPLDCLTMNLATVALVFAYINLFTFRTHDGRWI